MKYLLIFLFVIYWQFNLSAQSLFVVLDTASKPVPFANVLFYEEDSIVDGTYTNRAGQFYLNDSSVNRIRISHISYKDTMLYLNADTIKNEILLDKRDHSLRQVTVSDSLIDSRTLYIGRKLPLRRNFFGKNVVDDSKILYWIFGSEDASPGRSIVRLQRGFESDMKFIKSFVFHSETINIKNHNDFIKAVFYKNDNQSPGEKLHEKVFELTDEHEGRIEIDLKEKNILLPPEGLFIGIEFISFNELYSHEVKNNNTKCTEI